MHELEVRFGTRKRSNLRKPENRGAAIHVRDTHVRRAPCHEAALRRPAGQHGLPRDATRRAGYSSGLNSRAIRSASRTTRERRR